MKGLALGSALLLLAGCTQVAATGGGSGLQPYTEPDHLRAEVAGSPKTLNPLFSTTAQEILFEALTLEPLIAFGPGGKAIPILAAAVPTQQNGGISRDGLRITYHLRKGVRWQDGAPFSSRDVRFTWQAIMSPQNPVTTRHGYDTIADIETPDPLTAVIVLKRKYGPAIGTFFTYSDEPYFILPAHLLEREKSLFTSTFNSKPVGTGPYRVVSWSRGDRVEYEANDDYYLGKPKIKRVTIAIIPDENTAALRLRSHDADWFILPTVSVYPQIHAIPGITMTSTQPFTSVWSGVLLNTLRPPLNDVRVRRALAFATDKAAVVRDATYGTAQPARVDFNPQQWAYNPAAGTDRLDLARARALLDEAGWRAGTDGIRRKNGTPLTLQLAFDASTSESRKIGPLLAAMYTAIGAQVELKGYDPTMYAASSANGGILANGKFDLALFDWFAGVDPDNSSLITCAERPPNGWNYTGYCNPRMDEAQRIALTSYDQAVRKRAYAEVENLLADDVPIVYLYWQRILEPVNSDLKGFAPTGVVDDWNAYAWSFR